MNLENIGRNKENRGGKDAFSWFGKKLVARIVFFVLGIGSTLWFLIRVIPKPSRAAYPCMRAAAPLMSAFIVYLVSLASTVVFFRHARRLWSGTKYYAAAGALILAIAFGFIAGALHNSTAGAMLLADKSTFTLNDPIGTPTGLRQGRVVWVWDEDATDITCSNTEDDYWFQNTNQEIVDSMLHLGIQNLAGIFDTQEAWDSLFHYFNRKHGNGNVGYTAGEKIYVKINITNSCCSVSGTTKYTDFERMDATPEMVLSILKQLVVVVGVAQADIFIGDPFRTFHDLYWNMCHTVYPDVNYCDGKGINGRHQTVPTLGEILVFSDGVYDYRIPQEYVDATYFINMPCLKTHDSGGITLAAKNHQGSMLQDGVTSDNQSALDMHYSLPDHDASEGGHHRYRHLVDYMGHEQLGGKTLLIIVDGIWAGKSWEGWVEKWQMEPFDNDYPGSLFLSQDPVAIESVCWDFLLEEYASKPSNEQYPYMEGTGDFILQAASPDEWAPGVEYDPEGDGSLLGSLGVFEHWNNATDMSYTVIDFVKVLPHGGPVTQDNLTVNSEDDHDIKVYPNPAADELTIVYRLEQPGRATISVFNMAGKQIASLHNGYENAGNKHLTWNVNQLPEGSYLIVVKITTNEHTKTWVKRIQVI